MSVWAICSSSSWDEQILQVPHWNFPASNLCPLPLVLSRSDFQNWPSEFGPGLQFFLAILIQLQQWWCCGHWAEGTLCRAVLEEGHGVLCLHPLTWAVAIQQCMHRTIIAFSGSKRCAKLRMSVLPPCLATKPTFPYVRNSSRDSHVPVGTQTQTKSECYHCLFPYFPTNLCFHPQKSMTKNWFSSELKPVSIVLGHDCWVSAVFWRQVFVSPIQSRV